MFNVERLFTDPDFHKLIFRYCLKRGLDVSEMEQEVFAAILESGVNSLIECQKIANRVTMQAQRANDYIDAYELPYEEGVDGYDVDEKANTRDWYWRGVDPRMNKDVNPRNAWT